ncbi:hypothetical protein J6590_051239 [Homalodisca vitripennis]|nr:hypothetical protein J6590_051239 [Homalodisca vitripennis]
MISDETNVLKYVDARINEKLTSANDDSMMIKQYVEAQINEKLKDFASPYGDQTTIKQYVEAQINERLESFRRGGEVNLETLRHTVETVQNDLKSHTQKADELTSKVKFINNKVNVKNRRIVNAAKSVDEHDVVIRKEIDDLSRRLNEQTSFTLEENIRGFNRRYWTMESLQQKFGTYLKITKNSDRVTLRSPYNFRMDSNLCTLLGFKVDHTGQAGETVTATNPPNLRPVEIVEVHCDIIENSYVSHDVHKYRHHETAILYQFYPDVPHGYKISERPQYPHYVSVRSGLRKLQQIKLANTTQNNTALLNNDVTSYVYLDLVPDRA